MSEIFLDRPITTLFMLMSADGKITTGKTDEFDFDNDLPNIDGVSEGLSQYYEIEQTTDLWSLNTGRVQAKIGVNERIMPEKSCMSFVIIDNSHLTQHGVRYFCNLSQRFVLVTTNPHHPAFNIKEDNLEIIFQDKLNLREMLEQLKRNYGCERITIQSGGTLNGLFLREKLFDYIDIVIVPMLVGGRDVSTLIDGDSLFDLTRLNELGILKLETLTPLKHSYVRLRYKVIG